jgi:N-methylhydantoinase A
VRRARVERTIEKDFHRLHEAAYGHANPAGAIELVNARVAAYGVVAKPEPPVHRAGARMLKDARIEKRDVWFDGRAVQCAVYDRDLLPAAARIKGPAIIEEFGATTVVFPGWRATVDRLGGLLLERSR